MRLRTLAAAMPLALGLAHPAAARDPFMLEPSSPWEIDYAADSCALRRTFGEGQQQTQLEMRRFAPGLSLQTTVASKIRMTTRSIRFRFGDEGEWTNLENPLFAELDDDLGGVIIRHSLFEPPLDEDAEPEEWRQFYIDNDVPAMEAAAAASLENLTVMRAFKDDLTLRTGSLKAPIVALNQCIDDLMTHWGIDVEAHKTLTRSAHPVDSAWAAGMVRYPPKMILQRAPGLVNVRLAIDETGRATECHIQMTLSDPEFEESSCADIQRTFEFEPALDKDGKPMKSYYVTTVMFSGGI